MKASIESLSSNHVLSSIGRTGKNGRLRAWKSPMESPKLERGEGRLEKSNGEGFRKPSVRGDKVPGRYLEKPDLQENVRSG